MIIELCGGKTKCQGCKISMRKGDIRGVYGSGAYYNDPKTYYCIKCLMKKDFNISELIKIYKKKIKLYIVKIKNLEKLKMLI